jgi:hypothetical protein
MTPMKRTASNEKVEVVPGVQGPRWVTTASTSIASRSSRGIEYQLRIEFDDDEHRYLCTEFHARRSPEVDGGKGSITSEMLREPAVGADIALDLYLRRTVDGEIIELPNPDNIEPWGWTPPEGLSKEGPTDRALQWVAHVYHFGVAVSQNPAKTVEDTLKLSHGTTARWVRLARQKGYLGPAQGPGRPAR